MLQERIKYLAENRIPIRVRREDFAIRKLFYDEGIFWISGNDPINYWPSDNEDAYFWYLSFYASGNRYVITYSKIDDYNGFEYAFPDFLLGTSVNIDKNELMNLIGED